MTQVSKQSRPPARPSPSTPRQAARRRATFDKLIQPELLKALAEPTRATLLSCLLKCGRACSVTEVAQCCSLDFSTVARHLAILARAGALDAQKQGRTVWYTPRTAELAAHFRALAGAIDELSPTDPDCCDGACACHPHSPHSQS